MDETPEILTVGELMTEYYAAVHHVEKLNADLERQQNIVASVTEVRDQIYNQRQTARFRAQELLIRFHKALPVVP